MSTIHYNRLSTLSATASTASTAITTTAGASGASTKTSTNNAASQYNKVPATNASTTNTSSSLNNNGNNSSTLVAQESPIILQATLRKLKTMKKKIFVLYGDSQTKPARLEYYDNEKKFKSRTPKRTIVINSCFNINRRVDIKNKLVIALYTKDDCFCIVFETETELDTWLRHLLAQQRGDEAEGETPRPSFAFVWSVQVQRKGLAEEKGIIGGYHLCLTEQSLKMVRIGGETTLSGEQRMESVEFLLITIRRCGDSQCFFYMEVGRCSAIGAGELWMETEDPLIAQTMHRTIINAMSASVKNREENFPGPMSRTRSSSANEASKPISMLQRRQTHAGSKPLNFSPSGESPSDDIAESTSIQTNAVVESPNLSTNGGHGGGVGISPSSSYSGEMNGSSAGSAVTVIHVHRRQKSLPSPPQVVGGGVGTNIGLGGNGVNNTSKYNKDLSISTSNSSLNTIVSKGGSLTTSLSTNKLNATSSTIATTISTIATKSVSTSSSNNNKKTSTSNVNTTTTSLDTTCSTTNSTLNNNSNNNINNNNNNYNTDNNNYVPITADTAKNATSHLKNKNHNNNSHHHNHPPSTAPISTTAVTNNVLPSPPSSNNQQTTDILSHHVILAAAAAACSSSSTSCCCSYSPPSVNSITSLTNNYNNYNNNNSNNINNNNNNNNNNTTTASSGLATTTTGSSNHHHVLHHPPQHQQQHNMVLSQQSSPGSTMTTATSPSSSASSAASLLLTRTSRNPQYPMTAPLMRPTLGYCLLSTIQQRRHSVSATTGTACHHQRALSLPSATPILSNYGSNLNSQGGIAVNASGGGGTLNTTSSNIGNSSISNINSYQQQYMNNRHHHSLSSFCAASAATIATGSIGINGTGMQHSGLTSSPNTLSGIQPIHQRTRSLPLTEETAIQLPTPPIARGINRSNNNYNNNHHIIKSCSQQHFMLSSTTSLGSLNNNNNNCYLSNINNYCNAEINNNTAGTTSMESIVEDDVVDHVSTTTVPSSSTSQASTSSSPSPPPQPHLPPTSSNHHSGTFIKPSSSTMMGISSSYTSMSPLARNFAAAAAATSLSPSSITALPVASRSTTMGRERCDSLPSRNRTTSETSSVTNSSLASSSMPPPRTIPSLVGSRPHSMYNHRHSHSPPANSCPLSPSGGCSESDGSSLSIDETDGFVNSHTPEDYFMGRYTSHLTTSIPEEIDNWYESGKNDNDKITSMDMQSMNNNGGNNNLHNRLGMHTGGNLSLPITKEHTTRKGSPAPQSMGSTEGTAAYMEMHSPCGSSPGDPAGSGYMPMSPGVDFSRGIYTSSSGAHSRASSLAEETVDGYVPMGPPQTDGYVDMDPTHSHHQHHMHGLHHISHHLPTGGGMSSAASSCSIISGTPSTDIRFAEYHLDKVTSRFTPDEDDSTSLVERPARAYSVGSKPEPNKRKLRVDMLNAEHANSRVRAFSVGSRAKVPRSDLYRGTLTSAQVAIMNTQENASMINSTGSGSGSSTTGGYTTTAKEKKSSSAPMLSSHKSLGSVDPMDDLMEIDFSKTSERVSNSPMKASLPVPVPITRKLDPISSSRMMDISPKMTLSLGERTISGYVEMKPAGPRTSMIMTNIPQYLTRQKAHEEEDEYLDMRPGASLAKSPSLSSSPIKLLSSNRTNPLSSSPLSVSLGKSGTTVLNNSDYMDMSPRLDKSLINDSVNPKSYIASPKTSSDDYLNMSPGDRHIDKIMEVDLPKTASAPDEYMEMSWEKNNRDFINNIKEKPASEEYINIGFNRKDGNSFSSTPIRENRLSSLPIAIQSANKMSISSRSVGSKAGSGPIPGYLPLSSSNSITSSRGTASPARSNITRTRCDSKDSGIVTPSGSQATIFPFSPGSPMKPFSSSGDQYDANNLPRKCLVDGTSGTIRLSEEESEKENRQSVTPSPLDSPSGPSPIRYTCDPTKILNTSAKDMKYTSQTNDQQEKQVDTLSNNYADMTLGSNKMDSSSSSKTRIIEYADYVNCAPPATNSGYVTTKTNSMTIVSTPEEDMAGDYAIMDPVIARKMSSVLLSSSSATIQNTPPKKSLLVTINNSNLSNINPDKAVSGSSPTSATGSVTLLSSGFRPISSNVDEMLMRGGNFTCNKKSGSSAKLQRQNTTENSGYEVLSVQYGVNVLKNSLSRPNSVNSEKISISSKGSCNSLNRPNSANSDRLPMISASSSSSTLCGSTSSTTLCSGMDSKSQSPSASTTISGSRPQSVGDTGSRPESVTSVSDPHVTSRPPSVSSERELHYASLDLPPCSGQQNLSNHISDDTFNDAVSPVCLIGMSGSLSKHGSLSGDSSSTSPSPNTGSGSGQQQQPAFTYAKIDFVKSENLKSASATAGSTASTSQQTLIPHN